jgi:glutaminase
MSEDENRDDLRALLGDLQAIVSPLEALLERLYQRYRRLNDGAVATYIPELAKADPSWFSICIVTVDGQTYKAGNYRQSFTIQSVSKPFMYGLALEDHGREYVATKVGVEPTGDAFNAIMLDEQSNRPYNPMVNTGAIAVASLIKGAGPTQRLNRMLAMFGRYAGREILMDISVFTSERSTGHRNRAIAHLMRNFDMLDGSIDEILDLYFQQCSLLVTTQDLAMMAATLANGGLNPLSGERAVDMRQVRDILSVMYTCGMYDYSGEWAYEVGLPAKSGVSGGILAVVPRQMGIGVFSPALDARGNSVRGVKVCADLSQQFGLHIFDLGAEGRLFSQAVSGRLAL